MKIINHQLKFKTTEYLDFKDITEEVEKMVKDSEIKIGSVLVYSTHTTVAICINEHESGFYKDFKGLMSKLIPKDEYYQHNDLHVRTENLVCQSGASDCLNGHSHCTHLLMRNSELMPINDGKIIFGPWQRIFVIELDCARNREIWVQITGE